MWTDISKKVRDILLNDATTIGIAETIRLGAPAVNITDDDYPVIVVGRCSLVSSVFRGTLTQDRTEVWNCPVYIAIKSSIDNVEDGTVFDTQETLEQAVVSAILTDAAWNNESPYLEIELESSDEDTDIAIPYVATTYRFNITKNNYY